LSVDGTLGDVKYEFAFVRRDFPWNGACRRFFNPKRPQLDRELCGPRGTLLPRAEVIFEYRNSESSISHQQRIEFRQGFLSFLDTLWSTINLRNEVVQYQDGLFRRDVPVMNETVVREAILNAVTHRDYRLPGSIFVKQFPRKL
jgi:predicted HTH transcriptional regulator